MLLESPPTQRRNDQKMEKSKRHRGCGTGFKDGGQLLICVKIKAGQKPFPGLHSCRLCAGAVKQTRSGGAEEGLCLGRWGCQGLPATSNEPGGRRAASLWACKKNLEPLSNPDCIFIGPKAFTNLALRNIIRKRKENHLQKRKKIIEFNKHHQQRQQQQKKK